MPQQWNVLPGHDLLELLLTLAVAALSWLNLRWHRKTHSVIEQATANGVGWTLQEGHHDEATVGTEPVTELCLRPFGVDPRGHHFHFHVRIAIVASKHRH